MKLKNYIILISTLFYSQSGIAQSRDFFLEDTRTFYGGFVFGANFCQVDGDTYAGYNKVGLNGGGQVFVHLSPKILASVELLYSQRGARGLRAANSQYNGSYVSKYFIDLNYVELPLALHWAYNSKFHIGAGGSYSRLLNSKEDIISDYPVYFDPNLYAFRKEDVSAFLNAGYQFGKNLFLSLRYQRSVKSVRDWEKIPLGLGYGAQGQYNNVVTFRVSYLIK
jgi:hypothetical protein